MRISVGLLFLLFLLLGTVPTPATPPSDTRLPTTPRGESTSSFEKFAFVVISDTRTRYDAAGFESELHEIKDWIDHPTAAMPAPEFLVVNGDFDYSYLTDAIIDTVLGVDFTWYPIVGNHDFERYEDLVYCKETIFPALPWVVDPGPPGSVATSYAWEYENVHFVSANCYWNGLNHPDADHHGDASIHENLRNWMEAGFQATPLPHKFVFVHEPAYPEYRHVGTSLDEYPANRDSFIVMLDSNSVETLFVGHDHYYHHDDSTEHPLLGGVQQLDSGQMRAGGWGDGSTVVYVRVDGPRVTYRVYRSRTGVPYDLYEAWAVEDGTPVEYTLITDVLGDGTVAVSPARDAYDMGEPVEITATPAPGWSFFEWSGDFDGRDTPDTLTITGNMAVYAVFERVTAAPQSAVPSRTTLHRNFPNPFNPTTTIRFDLDREAAVALSVYDVSGRRVRTLVEDRLPPGSYAERWDGRDAGGNKVSSGVYLFRLTVGGEVFTQKANLVK